MKVKDKPLEKEMDMDIDMSDSIISSKSHSNRDRVKEQSPTPTSASENSSTGDLIEVNDFESLLKVCGSMGKWQLKVFLLASFVGFLTALHNLGYSFIGSPPESWCKLPNVKGSTESQVKSILIPKNKDDEYERCKRFGYNEDGFNGSSLEDLIVSNSTLECDSYTYDKSEFKSTIASEWDLVCDQAYLASAVQVYLHMYAIFMVGILVGSPIFGAISDKLGRKKAILIASVIFILAGPSVALAPNYWTVIIARFVLAFSSPGIYGSCFVLVIESIGPGWRGLFGNLFCLPFAFGYMTLPLFAYYFREWRTLQLILCAPSVFLLFTWWLLPESPRWLLRKGRLAEAEKILREMAAMNKKEKYTLPPNFSELIAKIANIEKEEKEEDSSWKGKIGGVFKGYADLLRSPNIRKRTLVLYVCWASISFIYYGVALNSPNLSADRHLYTFLSGLLEIPSYFIVPPMIRYLGRRPTFSGFLLICSACLLLSLFFEQGDVMAIIFALIGKLFIGAAYALIYLYATELLPTLLRTYGLGTASMVGRVGSATAPFIVDIVGVENKKYPTIIFGTVALIAGILSLILPETRNKRLPETIRDIEDNHV